MQNPALGAAAVDGLSVTIAGTIRSNRQPNTPKLVASIVFIQVGTISPGLGWLGSFGQNSGWDEWTALLS